MDWGFLEKQHNVGSIEQALMVVKSPLNMRCYKKKWFPAMEFFFSKQSFCRKILSTKKKLQKHGFQHTAMKGTLGFKFPSNASVQGFPNN